MISFRKCVLFSFEKQCESFLKNLHSFLYIFIERTKKLILIVHLTDHLKSFRSKLLLDQWLINGQSHYSLAKSNVVKRWMSKSFLFGRNDFQIPRGRKKCSIDIFMWKKIRPSRSRPKIAIFTYNIGFILSD